MLAVKFCPTCATTKRITDFNKNRFAIDGRQGQCRECANAHLREWRSDNAAEREHERDELLRDREAHGKVCTRCHVLTPLHAFRKDPRRKDGRCSACAECERTAAREAARAKRISGSGW